MLALVALSYRSLRSLDLLKGSNPITQIKSPSFKKSQKSSPMDKKCPQFWPNEQKVSILIYPTCEFSQTISSAKNSIQEKETS